MAFLESELLRMGKGEYDFSEMYIVHQTYLDRADAAVRTHGDVSFFPKEDHSMTLSMECKKIWSGTRRSYASGSHVW